MHKLSQILGLKMKKEYSDAVVLLQDCWLGR